MLQAIDVFVMVRNKWNKSSIILQLKRLHAEGQDIRSCALQRNHPRLYYAGKGHFGSLDKMYEAAGIDLLELNLQMARTGVRTRKCGKYTKESVVSLLLQLQSKGEDISVSSLRKKHHGLWMAGIKFYGNTWNMYIEAGLPPERYCQLKPPGYWSKPSITQEIKRMYRSGEDLHYNAVRKKRNDLINAANSRFGGWHKACAASGIPKSCYHIIDSRGTWNKVTIGNKIKEMRKAGQDLSEAAIRHDPNLRGGFLPACYRIHGNWYNTLEENGVNPDEYRRQAARGFWTEDRIKQMIRDMHDRKEDINARHVYLKHGDLFIAASKVFGSYENAVNKSGVNYDSIRRKHKDYTKEELLEYLRSLKATGHSLHVAEVKETSSSMVNIIIKRFGSYKAAIEAMGLDYGQIRKDQWSLSFSGRVFESCLREALEVLGWDLEFQKRFHLGNDVLRPDFVDLRTGTWIDAKLSSYSGRAADTIRKYQKHKKRVMIIYLDGNERVWPDGSVDFVPVSNFYEALKEAGAEKLVRDFEKLKKGIARPELQSEL